MTSMEISFLLEHYNTAHRKTILLMYKDITAKLVNYLIQQSTNTSTTRVKYLTKNISYCKPYSV